MHRQVIHPQEGEQMMAGLLVKAIGLTLGTETLFRKAKEYLFLSLR